MRNNFFWTHENLVNICKKVNGINAIPCKFDDSKTGIYTNKSESWELFRADYLSEVKSSFEIEHETPSATKAEAFVELLKKAHLTTQLDEECLVGLQNTAISNPLDGAVNYRHCNPPHPLM